MNLTKFQHICCLMKGGRGSPGWWSGAVFTKKNKIKSEMFNNRKS